MKVCDRASDEDRPMQAASRSKTIAGWACWANCETADRSVNFATAYDQRSIAPKILLYTYQDSIY